jgi:hypothetical protein
MVNDQGLVICDLTKIVLNDGVTLFPGYVEVSGGFITRYDSNDPFNFLATYKPWVHHNRVEYKTIASSRKTKQTWLNGKHFMSMKALRAYRDAKTSKNLTHRKQSDTVTGN